MKHDYEELKSVCQPVIDYLKKNGHPYMSITVSQRLIKLDETQISMSVQDKNDD
jgi:hypothetical protein